MAREFRAKVEAAQLLGRPRAIRQDNLLAF